MKKILLIIALLGSIVSISKAQTNYCKDIKSFAAGNIGTYTTPLPVWKSSEPSIQLSIIKTIKGNETTINMGIVTNLPVSAQPQSDILLQFEDGDKMSYSNVTVLVLPKTMGSFCSQFLLSNADIDKLKTKKLKSLTFLGSEAALTDSYKDKILGYMNCLGASLSVNSPTSTNTFTGKVIEGFWGIKFGSSPDEAKATALAKGGKLSDLSSANDLVFTDVIFTQRAVKTLSLNFVNNKFYRAIVTYPEQQETDIMGAYNNILSEISEVYGKPTLTKQFQPPFAEGDGYEVQAIKLGKASYNAVWKSNNNNLIMLLIHKDLSLSILYSDDKLENERQSKKSSDY